ncbi:MAG: HIT family protein [Burkholderiales bacterium]
MEPHTIFETPHWLVSHRADSRYQGYLLVSSREAKPDLHELSAAGLLELGSVLKNTEALLRSVYAPFKVIFAKLGFSGGPACHFHVVPVTHRLLAEISSHQEGAAEPDGSDAMLFVNRIYCERDLTPLEQAEMLHTVSILQRAANPLLNADARESVARAG